MKESKKEYIRKKNFEYYWRDPEKARAKARESRIKYLEYYKAYCKKYYRKNRKYMAKQSLAWRTKNKKLVYENHRRLIQNYRTRIFELLGNQCKNCEFQDRRALQIDHINGGGGKEIKRLGGNSSKYYKYIIETISKNNSTYQILCANCNWIKKHENNEN